MHQKSYSKKKAKFPKLTDDNVLMLILVNMAYDHYTDIIVLYYFQNILNFS